MSHREADVFRVGNRERRFERLVAAVARLGIADTLENGAFHADRGSPPERPVSRAVDPEPVVTWEQGAAGA
jgi:hypothetical protein